MSQQQDEMSVSSPSVINESKAKNPKPKITTTSSTTSKEKSPPSKRKLDDDENNVYVPHKVKLPSKELELVKSKKFDTLKGDILKSLVACVVAENNKNITKQNPKWLKKTQATSKANIINFLSDKFSIVEAAINDQVIELVKEDPIREAKKKKVSKKVNDNLKGKTLVDLPEELEVGSKVVILNSEMEIVSYGTLIDKGTLVKEDGESTTTCAVKITKSKEGSFYKVGGRYKIEMKIVVRLHHVEEETLTLEEARKAAQSSVTPTAIKPLTLVGSSSSSSPPSVVTTNKNVNPPSKQTTQSAKQPAKPQLVKQSAKQPSNQCDNQSAKQVIHELSEKIAMLEKKLANAQQESSKLRDKLATVEKKLMDRDLEDEVKVANKSDLERLAILGRFAVTIRNNIDKLMKSTDTITRVTWKGKVIPIDLTEEEKNALSSGKPTRAINFLLGFLEKHCKILDKNENYKLTKDTSKERSTRKSITPEMQENLVVAIQENCLRLAVNTNIKKLPQFITTYLDARQVKKGISFNNVAINVEDEEEEELVESDDPINETIDNGHNDDEFNVEDHEEEMIDDFDEDFDDFQ